MRKMLLVTVSALALSFVTASSALAADHDGHDHGKAVTLTGEGKCAKCALKETDKCQNVIQTKEDGKTVTYYIAKNDVSDTFHKNVCQGPKKITAKGTVKEVNGKKQLTATELKTVE